MSYTSIIGSTLYKCSDKYYIFENENKLNEFSNKLNTLKKHIQDNNINSIIKCGKITNIKGVANFRFNKNTAFNTMTCYHESIHIAIYVDSHIFLMTDGYVITRFKINNINSNVIILEGSYLDQNTYATTIFNLNNNNLSMHINEYKTYINYGSNSFGILLTAYIMAQFDINPIIELFNNAFNNHMNIYDIFHYDKFLQNQEFKDNLTLLLKSNINEYFNKVQYEQQKFLNQIYVY